MLFGAIDTAGSSLHVHRRWLDAVADNIANINTAKPTSGPAFQERFVVAEATGYGTVAEASGTAGVRLAGVQLGDPAGRIVHDPTSPMADADGNVLYPDIDLGDQMSHMILAQRGYQANLAVVERARDAYEAALQIGRT